MGDTPAETLPIWIKGNRDRRKWRKPFRFLGFYKMRQWNSSVVNMLIFKKREEWPQRQLRDQWGWFLGFKAWLLSPLHWIRSLDATQRAQDHRHGGNQISPVGLEMEPWTGLFFTLKIQWNLPCYILDLCGSSCSLLPCFFHLEWDVFSAWATIAIWKHTTCTISQDRKVASGRSMLWVLLTSDLIRLWFLFLDLTLESFKIWSLGSWNECDQEKNVVGNSWAECCGLNSILPKFMLNP
jgi:hypothetical protein